MNGQCVSAHLNKGIVPQNRTVLQFPNNQL